MSAAQVSPTKENCRKAIELFGRRPMVGTSGHAFITQFLKACEHKLPTDVAYRKQSNKNASRRKAVPLLDQMQMAAQ